MSLKRQHEEVDKETEQRIAELNIVQQIRFNLEGETKIVQRGRKFSSLQRNPSAAIFNLTDPFVLKRRLC
jgi:hypothetical protein